MAGFSTLTLPAATSAGPDNRTYDVVMRIEHTEVMTQLAHMHEPHNDRYIHGFTRSHV